MIVQTTQTDEYYSTLVAHTNAVRLLKEMEDRRRLPAWVIDEIRPWMSLEESRKLAEFKRNHPANRL